MKKFRVLAGLALIASSVAMATASHAGVNPEPNEICIITEHFTVCGI